MNVMDSVVQDYLKSDIPAFNVGDTVKVHVKIKEGNRERIQIFEGFVLKRQNGGIGETFTVRKISSGVGVEKTFPLHSPLVEKIEVVRQGDVRRASVREPVNRPRSRRKKNCNEKRSREGSFCSMDDFCRPPYCVKWVYPCQRFRERKA